VTLSAVLPRALIGLGLIIGLSIVTIGILRAWRRRSERVIQARSANVRPALLALVAGDEPDHLAIRKLADVDRRTWSAIEPTVVSLLAKVRGGSHAALVVLLDRRGAVAKAVSDLNSRSALARAKAAQLIGHTSRQQMARELHPLLYDPVPTVRRVAVRAIGRLGDPGSAGPLVAAAIADRSVPATLTGQALLRIGPPAGPALRLGLQSGRHELRTVCADILGLLGTTNAVDDLVALLDGPSSLASAAAAALGHIGAPAALRPLARAAKNNRADPVRAAAAIALGQVGATETVGTLADLLADPVHRVAQAAAGSLVQLGPLGRQLLYEAAQQGAAPGAYAAEALAFHPVGRDERELVLL
jgi:hypothetical protein